MAEEHTVNHMRKEFFVPKLANRNKRGNQSGENDAAARAQSFVRAIRQKPHESRIPPEVRERVLEAFPEILIGVRA